MIGPEHSHHSLNQSDAKLMLGRLRFSALNEFRLVLRCSHWLLTVFSFILVAVVLRQSIEKRSTWRLYRFLVLSLVRNRLQNVYLLLISVFRRKVQRERSDSTSF